MPYIRNLTVLALGLLAMSAHAGLVYRYTAPGVSGRVWIEGDQRRVELDPNPSNPRPWDVAITKQGKTTYVNLQNKTYYHEKVRDPGDELLGTSDHFGLPMMAGDRLNGKPKVTYQNAGAGPVLVGQPTTKHVIQVHYRLRGKIDGVPLRGEVDAVISVLMAAALPFPEEVPPVRTGFAEIDDELARIFATFEGMALRHEVSVNRRLDDNPASNKTSTKSIDELELTGVDSRMFAIPSGFTYQEPVFGGPG